MGFRCGIVGLPNVGKSTIFNALTAAAIAAENYPFCTIEPNVGIVPVPDERLDRLAELVHTRNKVATQMEFVDIAGLVKGASKGEGLGNQFLGHIRQVDAIVHVVRCFSDDNVVHVDGSVDPLRDREVINTELIIADLDTVYRRLAKTRNQAKSGDKKLLAQAVFLEQLHGVLDNGRPARAVEKSRDPAVPDRDIAGFDNRRNTGLGKDQAINQQNIRGQHKVTRSACKIIIFWYITGASCKMNVVARSREKYSGQG